MSKKKEQEQADDGAPAVGNGKENLLSVRPAHNTDALVKDGGVPKLLATNLSANPAKMSRLLIQADKRMTDYAGKFLSVVGYLVGHGTIAFNRETGDITVGHWLRVLLDDGTTASTTSPTLIRSFACLAQMFPDGQWASPVKVGIIAHDSAMNPGRWFECYLMDNSGGDK